jgi:hypothetical protein
MHQIPAWEPLSEEALADQRRTYDRMRTTCPVARSPRGVTLFRHADVVNAANDPGANDAAVTREQTLFGSPRSSRIVEDDCEAGTDRFYRYAQGEYRTIDHIDPAVSLGVKYV